MSCLLTAVIPTRNEAANIAACVRSFAGFREEAEVVVVDNSSTDATREIAAAEGARVVVQGPERTAQRNRGVREAAGTWILFLDADMTMGEETVREVLERVRANGPADAYYIPEVRCGRGLRARARAFERSFYDATAIDAVRLVRRSVFETVGGYDETLVACEDWDLDRRLVAAGANFASLRHPLVHHEAMLPLGKLLAKKAYYSASIGRYRSKWGEDAVMRRQFGLGYRFFGVFVEHGKWKRVLRHPLLFAVMMGERLAVAWTYLRNR